MKYNYLEFYMSVGREKPENIVNSKASCPFCNYDDSEEILAEDQDILLIKNKYQVLKGAYQLLVIEGNKCLADIPDYSLPHMQRVIRFAVKHWLEMINSKKYDTVLFFKNHGPLSGGTMRHPHMQIIGINNPELSIENMYDIEQFDGIELVSEDSVSMNLSTRPRVGFNELNIILKDLKEIDCFAKYIQQGVDFILNKYQSKCNSYNLFFYYIREVVYVKIIPRYATSPLFIGYNIELVPDDLAITAERFKACYGYDK